jgi:hypothetical protein
MSKTIKYEIPQGWSDACNRLDAIVEYKESYDCYVSTAIELLTYIFDYVVQEELPQDKEFALGWWGHQVGHVTGCSRSLSTPQGLEQELVDFIEEKSAYLENWNGVRPEVLTHLETFTKRYDKVLKHLAEK